MLVIMLKGCCWTEYLFHISFHVTYSITYLDQQSLKIVSSNLASCSQRMLSLGFACHQQRVFIIQFPFISVFCLLIIFPLYLTCLKVLLYFPWSSNLLILIFSRTTTYHLSKEQILLNSSNSRSILFSQVVRSWESKRSRAHG